MNVVSNVKWIKITTNMFDDEKIKIIESMPDRDAILIIWIKLLVQAGKTNASGFIYLSENIPYTDEMLATIFNRPINTVRLALKTFADFGMIQIDENSRIEITNWSSHQSVDGMDKLRERDRLRKQKKRAELKLEAAKTDEKSSECPLTSPGNVRRSPSLDLEEEIDQEIDQEKEREKEKNKDSSSSFDDDLDESNPNEQLRKLVAAYENDGFGPLTYSIAERLKDFREEYGVEWTLLAMKQAVLANKRSLNYVRGVLQNWRRDGGLESREAREQTRQERKQPNERRDKYSEFYSLFPDTQE